MKSYDELKAEMEVIQQQMLEDVTNDFTNPLTKINCFCNELGLTVGIQKVSLDGGRKKR